LDQNYHFLLDHQLWIKLAMIAEIRHEPRIWAFARHHKDAKNIALSVNFSKEAFQILDWMKTQGELARIIDQNSKTVMSMLHRFNARYLLDGGQEWESLKSYFSSFTANPTIALREWHRILFACLSLVGLRGLGKFYYQAKLKRIPASIAAMGINNIDELYSDIGM